MGANEQPQGVGGRGSANSYLPLSNTYHMSRCRWIPCYTGVLSASFAESAQRLRSRGHRTLELEDLKKAGTEFTSPGSADLVHRSSRTQPSSLEWISHSTMTSTDRFFSSEVGASARAPDFTAVWPDGTVSIAGLAATEWAKQELHLTAAEYFGFLVLFSYVVVYIVGRRRNYQIAKGFIDGVHGLFCSRFVHAGPASEIPRTDQWQLLARDSCKTFLYYATGSRRCSGVLVTIDLVSRHDLFMLAWNLFSPATDRVTLEVAFDDDDIEPTIFAIVRKRDVKRLLQEVPHLQDYAGVARAPSLRPSLGLVCVTEAVALLDPLLPLWASKAVDEAQDLLELLHVTDRNEQPILGRKETPRKALRVLFRLPAGSGSGNGSARKMIELALGYVELLHRFKMSPGTRKKARERREAVAKRKSQMTHAQRQERFQQLKDERLQREREEYEGFTPDQKRRRDLRDEKRAKKSSSSRRIKIKLTKA